jgi:serine phosphatase RsbU (regulator of sigma subunit)
MIRAVIVDDEPAARERLRRMLSHLQVAVLTEAGDARSAVDAIDRTGPDVVFLDVQMPELSGFQVAALLRPPRPRVLFCTDPEPAALEALDRHALDYLHKPVSRHQLAGMLQLLVLEMQIELRARRGADDAIAAGRLEWATLSEPAERLGTTYCDVRHAGSGRTGLALGHVSEAGACPGVAASAVHARMQALMTHGAEDAGRVLSELNSLMLGSLESHQFITLFLALYDPASSSIIYASAGHPPPIALSPHGSPRTFDAAGPRIGQPDAHFASSREPVAPGELLAIHSAGVTTTTAPRGEALGLGGLVRLLRSHQSLPLADMARATLADVAAFGGGMPAPEDRTLLLARIR